MVVVVGLGRFGSALSTELLDLGHEVMGLDTDDRLVQAAASELTLAVQADATDEAAMRQLGVQEANHAVIAIGDDVQASILATATMVDLGIGDIWAKAQTEQHARILERVGADNVVFPERDMGQRVAHRVTGRMLEYIKIDADFALVETPVPGDLVGRTLLEASIRSEHHVNVVGIKPSTGGFSHPRPDTRLAEGDILLVSGTQRAVERFASAT